MKVQVKTDRETTAELEEGSTIAHLLKDLGINRETVLVKKDGMVCIEDEALVDGDRVEIITVVSGG